MRNIYILFAFCLPVFLSCDLGTEPDIGGVEIEEMTGEWWVTFTVDGDDIYGLGHTLISTYNTAGNTTTEMWLDDLGHTWQYKLRVPINLEAQSFAGTDIDEQYHGITATVSGGLITEMDTESSGGNITDGISFNIVFSDDPETTYHIAGYRRTGFQEDEH